MTDTKAWRAFSLFIRLRDTDNDGYGKCFTCPRTIKYTEGDCGHGIPRQHKATKLSEKNNHLQCKHCNGFEGGRREVYKAEMDKKYGSGTWDLMEMASKQICKRTQFETDVIEKYYLQKALELWSKKNLSNKPSWLRLKK